jgi:hypothetical protein
MAPAKGWSLSMRRACSDMMLQLPHLLQAGQAEIPIQFVDEIPHDRIPFWCNGGTLDRVCFRPASRRPENGFIEGE